MFTGYTFCDFKGTTSVREKRQDSSTGLLRASISRFVQIVKYDCRDTGMDSMHRTLRLCELDGSYCGRLPAIRNLFTAARYTFDYT